MSKFLIVKGALSRILTDFWTAKIYICVEGNEKNISPFLLTIVILEHRNCQQASSAADGYDGNGLQLEKFS